MCMCMCVYVFICVCVCVCARACACVHVYMYLYVHVYVHVRVFCAHVNVRSMTRPTHDFSRGYDTRVGADGGGDKSPETEGQRDFVRAFAKSICKGASASGG